MNNTPEAQDLPVTDTHETHEQRGDRDYPWILRAIKEFGFPVATALILMSILVFIGKWMVDNQQRLIDSTVKTNESLTEANKQNAQTLIQMERAIAANCATLLASSQGNGELIRTHMELTKKNETLNQKQTELLEGVTKTHSLQTEQIEQISSIIENAAKVMEPVPRQREEGLKKQDEANRMLSELLVETKKRS
jgi:hypothetical protein